MGTKISHRTWGWNARRALRAVLAEAERLERLLSRFVPESDISRLNRSAGAAWESLHPHTFTLLAAADQFYKQSGGLFDITIGPLMELWDFQNASVPPDREMIMRKLPLVCGGSLRLDPAANRARLMKPGQSVDPGGIGKGYAADRFIVIVKEHRCRSAWTNLGGNVSLLGRRPDGKPWTVGIRHPRESGRLLGAVKAHDCSVVTSGDYERCFTGLDGQLYQHILDPATGRPADSGLISVTVIAQSAMAADALSTAVFVAGLEKGMMLLQNFLDADAVLVDKEGTVFVTGRLVDRFTAAEGISFTALR
jgi:thiamine biosynthesis lipoprotein